MVDTHCHLDACKDAPDDLVQRARAVGINRLATVGMDGASIERSLALANAHDEVFAIVGRHPNEARDFDVEALAEIERAAADRNVIAIGETGLDYYRERAPRTEQVSAFEAQIELARALDLPIVIHTRDAADETLSLLAETAVGLTVVLHCFSIPDRLAECIERGYICSFAGNVTYSKASELQAAARAVPDELLLVETDSPYLAPQPMRGKPNEPANVVATAEHVAHLRGVDYEQLEALVERNARRVFGW